MSLIEYLISKGYKPYRKVYTNKRWEYVPEEKNTDYFSSAVGGYMDIRLIKDDKEIIYGLQEKDHPPTLIYPKLASNRYEQDRLLKDKSVDEVYNLIILNYECNKGIL